LEKDHLFVAAIGESGYTGGEVMEGMVIRRATAEDVPGLSALIEASVRGLQAGEYTAGEIEGALGHALGLDSQLIEDGTYFVAEDEGGGRMVGCGGWSWRQKLCGSDGLDAVSSCGGGVSEGGAAKIRAIFVHPGWARRGLGSLILAHCERLAQEAGFRRLEMGSTLTGVALYRLRGYRETERISIALPNGEALAVVRMVKDL
jgi:ribosomal protein S18 acetylase RimI-like enzyme